MTAVFDFAAASSAETLAEVARRDDLRRRGEPIAPRLVQVIKPRAVRKSDAPVEFVDAGDRPRLSLELTALAPGRVRP
jgi:hypothetical protein